MWRQVFPTGDGLQKKTGSKTGPGGRHRVESERERLAVTSVAAAVRRHNGSSRVATLGESVRVVGVPWVSGLDGVTASVAVGQAGSDEGSQGGAGGLSCSSSDSLVHWHWHWLWSVLSRLLHGVHFVHTAGLAWLPDPPGLPELSPAPVVSCRRGQHPWPALSWRAGCAEPSTAAGLAVLHGWRRARAARPTCSASTCLLSLWSETRRGTTHAVELGGDLLAVESGNAGSDGVVGAAEQVSERGHGEAITGL